MAKYKQEKKKNFGSAALILILCSKQSILC